MNMSTNTTQTLQENSLPSIENVDTSQAIDSASNAIDELLMKNMSDAQKESITHGYQQLNTLFEIDKLSATQEKSINTLMNTIDNAFKAALETLPAADKKVFDQLAAKIAHLESTIA